METARQVIYAKQTAIRELDLTYEATEKGDLRNSLFDKKLGHIAINEMMMIIIININTIDDLSRR